MVVWALESLPNPEHKNLDFFEKSCLPKIFAYSVKYFSEKITRETKSVELQLPLFFFSETTSKSEVFTMKIVILVDREAIGRVGTVRTVPDKLAQEWIDKKLAAKHTPENVLIANTPKPTPQQRVQRKASKKTKKKK